ncbi:MAG: DUF4350 domain-containing protein [Novosphingobium sp.]|nr:DUF4350 domain-containing protein [Novosphingobium sp.]MBO9603465.1 DUF4350 domain-containing protein [Novosphingobium sp.]
MSGGGSPFSPRAVLALLVLGAAAFLAVLFLIGTGADAPDEKDGGGHAAGNGLNGYAAFSELLGRRGYQVSAIRNAARLDDPSLLILTPPPYADADELNRVIERHRNLGPVILILPKWFALPVGARPNLKSKKGWVVLFGATSPAWGDKIGRDKLMRLRLDQPQGKQKPPPVGWSGLGFAGKLPDPSAVQWVDSSEFEPLVRTAEHKDLVSFWDDGGYYPRLSAAAGVDPYDRDEASDKWPLVVIAEPDLVNNYGLADKDRALLALSIVEASLEGAHMPVAFDLTFNGLGQNDNLLTLAFRPPFLAATLCFLIAALVVAWRAFRRFGPPAGAGGPRMGRRQLAAGGVDEAAAMATFAFGKRELATNGAALIQRAKRLHLLGAPYAALVRNRIAQALGLRPGADIALTEGAIDALLERRGLQPNFASQAEALRQARGPHELLRRAHALREIERNLSR